MAHSINEADCEMVVDAPEVDGGAIICLDRARDLACPANKVLVDWDIYNAGGGNYRMEYKCCGLTVQ